MIKDYFILALRNIKSRGIRSVLTMLGVFIGIAAVVSLISLGQGLQEAITGQFSTLSADRLLIQNSGTGFGPPGSTSVSKLTDHDFKIIEGVSGVDRAIKRTLRIGKIEYNKVARFEFIGSLPEEQEDIDYMYDTFEMKLDSGKLISASDSGSVILGNDFLTDNRYDKDIRVGTVLDIQGKKFRVQGILKKMSSFQFNSAIFMSEKDMKDLFNIKDEIDFIVVQVDDKDNLDRIAKDIAEKLRRDRHLDKGEEDFSVETPVQALGAVNTILNIINIIVVGIAAISLLVGGIGITNTFFTSVLERTKEIGTMKAVGAKNKDILIIFLIESALLGFVGGIIGVILGLGLAFTVAGIANSAFGDTILAVQVSYPLIFSALIFSSVIGIIAGLIPAFQASKLKPVEALRR
ncbi:MAG: ABC transporter permease [Nanoarchaeota archaeon]